ncbi:uncharacterized protein LOC135213163, partial [Macrobrachium nipponense]|uniref:uncharacterized protein LOC135213163 n=1 Tax=Macrobrachium nipponense TaxID=159736 RepID=UPI0030C7FEA9
MASVAPSRKPRSRSLDQASLHESGVRLLRLRISRRQHDGSRSPRTQGVGADTSASTSSSSSSAQESHVQEARGLLKHNALALKNVARSLLGSPAGGRFSAGIGSGIGSGGGGASGGSSAGSGAGSSGLAGRLPVHGTGLTKGERPSRSLSTDREETAGLWVNRTALINEVCSSPYRRRHSMTPSLGASSCSPPLRRHNLQLLPCHQQSANVTLPPDPPKPFLVGGRVFYFYSSDDWRAAFQNQDRRAAAAAAANAPSCSLHPSCSGGQLESSCSTSQRQQPWNFPEPDRLAPQLPEHQDGIGGSPQRRFRSCSVGTACEAATRCSLLHPGGLNLNFDSFDDDDDEDTPGPNIYPTCSYMRPRAASEQYSSPLHMKHGDKSQMRRHSGDVDRRRHGSGSSHHNVYVR